MRCPKCGYNSFDHLDSCKKCSADLGEFKQRYGIKSVLFPGQMKPVMSADADTDSSVVDAAVAAATAATVATAATAATAAASSAAGEASSEPSGEADDFGFDFMGESDEEEDLSFDELFEEAPAEEDVEESLPSPDTPEAAAADEPVEAVEEVAEFSFDSVPDDEPADAATELPSEAELDEDFGFDLDDAAEAEPAAETVAGEGPVDDLASDDFDLPPADADDFDFNTDEIEFSDEEETSGTEEDPKSPFEVPESPQVEVAPEPVADLLGPAPETADASELLSPSSDVTPQPETTGSLSAARLTAELATADTSLPLTSPVEEIAPADLSVLASASKAPAAEPTLPPVVDEPDSELSLAPFADDDQLLDDDDGWDTELAAELAQLEEVADDTALADLLPLSATAAAGVAAARWDAADEGADAPVLTRSARQKMLPALPSRIAAFACDLLLLLLISVSFIVAAEAAMAGSFALLVPSLATLIDLSVPYFLVLFSLAFGYFTLFHFLVGQTPGKMLAGLRVETLDGEPLLLSQAFLRTVGGLLQLLPIGLGYLVALLDAERRGWNDRLAGTRMISLKGRADSL